ncbi:acyl-CoA dehydrogenase [Streptomyces echinatus]|uniref:Alkylation response protein AidB-like acyl-CoA dehydrogenase n=1 Tax=Streptomyces echinatus TaxID=67293 RepID=A0A7W9PP96_9ACTN|nr:acyl-CoA dehydrogenase [Streptomyces echinatus]MBB5925316.1 alkylation response protein AidB-like acyl-CoA dehydrogenase [Streptomyces echinatus]
MTSARSADTAPRPGTGTGPAGAPEAGRPEDADPREATPRPEATGYPEGTGCPEAAGRPADVDRLERLFGDAGDPANPVGRNAVLAADDRAGMLAAGEDLLTRFGLNAHFVPRDLGGRFEQLDDLVRVMRAVYRRDPCLGLGYGAGSFMAAVNVWTAGSTGQRERLAGRLLSGGRAACAYHELDHGNDFTRAGLTALPGPDGRLRLNGRKEVVANLRRAETVVLFARTDPAHGSRSHSQLLFDTADLPAAAVRHLDRYPTVGMRGVQLGGIEFTDCPVPDDSVVGRPGQGVETALRSFQLTRVALPGMTIGLLDTALRTALRGARGRTLYGGRAADLPLSRTILAETFADLLLADTFTTVAARAAHTAPAQAGVYASAVKSFVPTVLIRAVQRLSELLGSQFYLRAGEQPLFQKLLRDVQPSAFGHASRVSCQSALLAQLPLTARRGWRADTADPLPADTFRAGRPLPPLRFADLAVSAAGRDPLARSLVVATASAAPDDPLAGSGRAWCARLAELTADASGLAPTLIGPDAPPYAFGLTARWTGVLAASACLNTWWNRPAEAAGSAADPAVTLAVLHRLGSHLDHHREPLPPRLAEPLYAELGRRLDAGLTFDLDRRPTGA